MREAWTDDRLDELNRKVDEGFDRLDARFERVEERFDRADRQFERVEERFHAVHDRLHGIQRTMFLGACMLSGTFVAGFAALIGLVATQA